MTQTPDPALTPAPAIAFPDVFRYEPREGVHIESRPLLVLVWDDDSGRMEALGDLLRSLPYNIDVTCASDADAAHNSIAEGNFDLYFIQAPDDITALVQTLRRTECSPGIGPVIVVCETHDIQHHYQEKMLSEGVFDVVMRDDLTELGAMHTVRLAVASARTHQALAGCRDKLEKVFASAPIALFVLNLAGVAVHFEGRPVAGLPPALDGWDKLSWLTGEGPAGLAKHVRRALQGESFSVELESDRGAYHIAFGPLLHEGRLGGVYGIATDVTASALANRHLREREEYFRILTESVHGYITVLDREACITYQSPGVEAMLGYPAGDRLGQSAFDLVHPEDLGRAEAQFAAALSDDGVSDSDNVRLRRADGTWRYVSITWLNLLDDALVGGIVATARDVTERVESERARSHAQDELRRAQADLESRVHERTKDLNNALEKLNEAHAMQKRFIADASHDFRTPLTAIRGETELLAQQNLTDDVRASLDAIRAETIRLESLAIDLLLLAKLDAGTAPTRHRTLRLDELVLDALGQLRRQTRERDATWDLEVADEIFVCGDQSMLTRAIANVLDNAIKYSPPHATIRMRLYRDGQHGTVTISDDGTGISDSDIAHVFERFFRGEASRNTPGSGLGLSIVKHVIDAHSGSVVLDSTPGRGTSVTVRLPAETIEDR